jgi:PAS domain S-box-containing protein
MKLTQISRRWPAVVFLLVLLFVVWSARLIVVARSHQNTAIHNFEVINHLNELEQSIRGLQQWLPKTLPASFETSQSRWQQLKSTYRNQRATIDDNRADEPINESLSQVDAAVSQMDALHTRLLESQADPVKAQRLAIDLLEHGNRAIDEVQGAVHLIRQRQVGHWRQVVSHWWQLGIIMLVASLLGVSAAILLRRHQQEIIRRRKTEAALLESERRYKDLVEHANDLIYQTDAAGRLTFFNPAAIRLMKYAADELLGRYYLDLIREDYRSDADRFYCAQIAGCVPSTYYEFPAVAKDGTIVWLGQKVQLVTEGDRVTGVQAMARDITERKAAEMALQETNQMLRALVQASPLAILVIDRESQVEVWNPAAERIFGWSEPEVVGRPLPFIPEDKRDEYQALRQTMLQGQAYTDFETYRLRKDGSLVDVAISTAALYDAEEGMIGTVAMIADITERKQKDRLALTLGSIGDGIIATGIEGNIALFNKVAEKLTGWTTEEAIGKPLNDIFRILNEKTREQCDDPVKVVLQTGNTAPLKNHTILIAKDGTERIIADSGAPMRDKDGHIIGVVLAFHDITERKRAEETLRESEERFRRYFELGLIGMAITSPTGICLEVNDHICDISGYTRSEMLQMTWMELTHPDDLAADAAHLNRVLAGEIDGYSLDKRFIRKDGQVMHATISVKCLRRADGSIDYFVALVQDITEKRRMEEELLKASKLESLGVLAGGIAHDLNNILTAIIGNLSLAKQLISPGDRALESLNEAEWAGLRASRLANQLLAFSRGGAPIKQAALITGLMRSAAQLALSGSNIRCEFELADDLWPVEVDEGQIRQVIQNLVLNAQQAMPLGGVVRLRARNLALAGDRLPLPAGRYVEIAIQDQGVGIAEEDRAKIFDPFFTTKPGGSGLGLATAYSIINKHNGHLSVASETGVGSTFTITLPAAEQATVSVRETANETSVVKGKILVMDDEEMIRNLCRSILTGFGYKAEMARDGAEAIALYKQAKAAGVPFDAVIMDLTVPGGMGGKEAIQRLQAIDPQIKAIVSSGYSDDPIMADYRRYGFSGVVAKPYDVNDLIATLNTVLQGTRSDASNGAA